MNDPRTHAELAANGKSRPGVLPPLRKAGPAPSLTVTAIADALKGCAIDDHPLVEEERLTIARHLEPWWREFSIEVAQQQLRRLREVWEAR